MSLLFWALREVNYNITRKPSRMFAGEPNRTWKFVSCGKDPIFFKVFEFAKETISYTPTGTEHPPFPYHGNQVPRSSTRGSLVKALCKVNIPSRGLKFCTWQGYSNVHHTLHQTGLWDTFYTHSAHKSYNNVCPQIFSNGVDEIL